MNPVEKKAASLLRAREKYLVPRKASEIAGSLGALSRKWLDPKYPFRKKAVTRLVRESGFTAAMAEAMLDALFSELTAPKLKELLHAELVEGKFLDGFYPRAGFKSRAHGPRILVHVFSGNLPNPSVTSLVHGLLVKSAGVVKASSRDAGILNEYLASLKKEDAGLAETVFFIDPKDRTVLRRWMDAADAVTAYGDNDTMAALRPMAAGKIFTGHGHRVSFSLYTKGAMKKSCCAALAENTARDVWMADQRGCLSPSVIYVERGGEVSPEEFARNVAASLARFSCGEAFAKDFSGRTMGKLALKNRWKLKKIGGENAFFIVSSHPGEWAVFYSEKGGEFPLSCGGQTIFIRPLKEWREVLREIKPFQKYLQAAALEALPSGRERIAESLAAAGVARVTRAGRLQEPPAAWHHDGKSGLAAWLRWTGLE